MAGDVGGPDGAGGPIRSHIAIEESKEFDFTLAEIVSESRRNNVLL